jgi:hypothetical protein
LSGSGETACAKIGEIGRARSHERAFSIWWCIVDECRTLCLAPDDGTLAVIREVQRLLDDARPQL